jgi:hypothetical protein
MEDSCIDVGGVPLLAVITQRVLSNDRCLAWQLWYVAAGAARALHSQRPSCITPDYVLLRGDSTTSC